MKHLYKKWNEEWGCESVADDSTQSIECLYRHYNPD